MEGKAWQSRALHITVARKQRDRKRLGQNDCKDPPPATIYFLCLFLKSKALLKHTMDWGPGV